MRTLSKKQKATVAAVTLLALSGTGTLAYAFWTSTGSGTGSATTGTDTPFTIVNQSTVGAALSPDGPTQAASFQVHNPGSGVQQMNQVVVTVANSDGSAWTPVGGCTASDYALGGGLAGASHTITNVASIAAGGNSAVLGVNIQMVDTGLNQNGCKGLTVPLYYVVS